MAYRLEYAVSGRAICKATECKKNGVKIGKGELRHGTFVEIMEHQSWTWKHWGCVTPRIIANMKEKIEGNLDYLDGYEDLTEIDQAKVRQAITDGHVADEDWKWDQEMNRPGMNGFRSPAYKAKQRADKKAAEELNRPESPSKPETHGRELNTKMQKTSDLEDSIDSAAMPKKKRVRAKQESETEATEADTKPTLKSKHAKTKKDMNGNINSEESLKPIPERNRRRARVKNKSTAVQDNLEELKLENTKAALHAVESESGNTHTTSDEAVPIVRKAKGRAKKGSHKVKTKAETSGEDASEYEDKKQLTRAKRIKREGKSGSRMMTSKTYDDIPVKEEERHSDEPVAHAPKHRNTRAKQVKAP